MKIRGILFDMDGTLIDSADSILKSLNDTLHDLNSPPIEPSQIRPLIGPPLHSWLGQLLSAKGLGHLDVDNVVARFRKHYTTKYINESPLFDGITEMLASLRSQKIALGVATSKKHEVAQKIIDDLELNSDFDTVCGSREELGIKTKSDVVRSALAHPVFAKIFAEDPSSIWMVGDRHHDIEGALANNIIPIGILWGYGSHAELTGSGAKRCFSNPREIDEAVLGLNNN